MFMRAYPALAAALAVASCGTPTQTTATSTVTVTVSAQSSAPATPITPPPPLTPTTTESTQGGSYSQDGVYSIGTTPSGGLSAAIQPGRYRAEVKTTGMYADYGGTWIRCSSHLCGLAHPETTIAIGNLFTGQLPSVVEIAPTDVAVSITGLVLTPVD